MNKSIAVGDSDEISIEIISGSLVLRGVPGGAVEVTGTIGDDVEELVVERHGSRIVVRMESDDEKRRGRWRNVDVDTDLEISLPPHLEVDAETVSANIAASGLDGKLDLESVSGDIEVEGGSSEADLATVSGSILFSGRNARVEAASVSGNVVLRGVSGQAEVESVSGNVEVEADEISRLEMSSVSGDVEFRGRLAANARVEVESHSGDVDLDFGGAAAGRFEIETYSGRIINELSSDRPQERRYGPGASVGFTLGSDGTVVEIESFSGSVRVR